MDFNVWMNALTKPAETFAAQKGKGGISEGAVNFAIAFAVSALISAIVAFLMPTPTVAIEGYDFAVPKPGPESIIINPIMGAIVGVILMFIAVGILYVMAMILGGKGGFGAQYYLTSIYYAPIAIITAILGVVPVVGGILGLLLGLYSLYLLTIMLKTLHEFSILMAVLTWLIPGVVLFLVVFVLLAAIFAPYLALLGGGMKLPV